MKRKSDFKLTEPVILTLEREKQDASLLKKYRKKQEHRATYKTRILQLFFIVLFIGSAAYIGIWHYNNIKNEQVIQTVSNFASVIDTVPGKKPSLDIDFNGLRAINDSCFGWIKVNNTNISYPVVKHTDNDYYLSHSFDYSQNTAGWIFADYRNACNGYDKNLIIYGHNRKNNTMFSELNDCLNSDWYTNIDNKIINLYTPEGTINYSIFSIYSIEVEDYYTTTAFLSDNAFQDFIDEMKSRSVYEFNTAVDSTDNILTLSTCANNNTNRTVIHAKKLLD